MMNMSVAKAGLATLAVLVLAVSAPGAGSQAGGLAQSGAPARAGDWVSGHASRARLVPGPLLAGGQHLAGIQIELEPGWHTYWRSPGDSGVPPRFDWSRSLNVAAAEVRYPAPRLFRDPFGTSIGYEDEVAFPVLVTAGDLPGPVELVVKLDYAVCADICVPLTVELAATLDPDVAPAPDAASLVSSYNRKVPRIQEGGSDQSPSIGRAWLEPGGGGAIMHLAAKGAFPADLFVEGPPGFYFPSATAMAGPEQGSLMFAVEVDGAAKPGGLAGARLTATLVAADGAVEHSWTVE
jgi:DsbC/DsbD-like thiol-disulfide interchange protein